MNTKKEMALNLLDEFTTHMLMELHSAYCEANRYYDDEIWHVADLDNYFDASATAYEIITTAREINFSDRYFQADAYGCLHSFNSYADAYRNYLDEIAEAIANEDYQNWDLNEDIRKSIADWME